MMQMLRSTDTELPDGIIYHILHKLPKEKNSIILSTEKVKFELKQNGYYVTRGYAVWRLKKCQYYVPSGWMIQRQWNSSNGGLRIKFVRIKL